MISTVSSGVKSDKQFLTAGDDVRLKNSLKEGGNKWIKTIR
jgi:hypothetical protein